MTRKFTAEEIKSLLETMSEDTPEVSERTILASSRLFPTIDAVSVNFQVASMKELAQERVRGAIMRAAMDEMEKLGLDQATFSLSGHAKF